MRFHFAWLLIVAYSAIPVVFAEGLSGTKAEIKAGRAVDALLRMKHSPGEIEQWAKKVRVNLGLSEEQLLDGFVSRIKQVDPVVNQEMHSSHEYNEFLALHAAQFAIDLYPGSSRLEEVVLNAYRRSVSTGSKARGSWISLIADHGSDQGVSELRKLLVAPREIEEFDRWVSSRARFERPPKLPVSNTGIESSRLSGPSERRPSALLIWNFWVGLAGMGLATYGIVRKIRSVWIGGVGLVILAVAFYYFRREALESQLSSPPPANATNESGFASNAKTNLPDASKPDVLRPPAQVNSSTTPRVRTAFDRLQEEVTKLMPPFSIVDPLDRAGNLGEREAAAAKLLDLLKAGMPEGCRVENWPMMVKKIVEVQSCSAANMDRAMKMVSAWIGNPTRTDQETMTALMVMMRWQQKTPFKRGTPELQRYERIAEMQVAMFDQATPEVRGQLLWNIEQAAKIISEPKSEMPEKLISGARLLELVGSLRREAPADPLIAGQSLMVLSNRLRDDPEAFPIFENTVRELLAGNQVTVMGRTNALEILTSLAKRTGSLPPWAGNEEIARQLSGLQAEADHRGANGQPTGKELGFINGQAIAVIRNRVGITPDAGRVYGRLLTDIAGEASTDSTWRLEAVRLAVAAGAISADDVRSRFSNDPAIGIKVKEALPETK
jgi:hypothetical protein